MDVFFLAEMIDTYNRQTAGWKASASGHVYNRYQIFIYQYIVEKTPGLESIY